MMRRIRAPQLKAISVAVLAVALPATGRAEIGIPVRSGGVYMSIEGGYQNLDAAGVSSGGASTSVNGNPGGAGAACGSQSLFSTSCAVGAGTESARGVSDGGGFASAEDGAFGSLGFGYVLPSPMFGLLDRLEIVGSFARSDDDKESFGAFGMRSVDNSLTIAIARAPIEFLRAATDVREESSEIVLRFKSDTKVSGSSLLTLSFEPFYRRSETEVSTRAAGDFFGKISRDTDIDSDTFGALLALEGRMPIASNVSIVGRGYGGLYHTEADGKFSDRIATFLPLAHHVDDDDGFGGYRVGGEVGLQVEVTPGARVTLFGAADYLSDVATAVLPRFQSDRAAHIDQDDLTVWRTGLRLTLSAD